MLRARWPRESDIKEVEEKQGCVTTPGGCPAMARPPAPGSVIVPDWHESAEGKEYLACILRKNRRRVFGLLERPVLPPPLAIDTASYKIFVSGKSGVGKTALVAKLAGLEVPMVHHETTGIQTTVVFWPAKLQTSDRVVMFRFEFWDCGETALKKFDHMLPACKEKTDAFLFLFSFTDRASFEDLPGQLARITGLGTAPPAGEERARAAAGRWAHAGWAGWAGRHCPRAQWTGGAAVAPGPGGSWPAPQHPRQHPQLRCGSIMSGHL
ncbi:ciliogenesis and planar polarity effector 2 isoform 2-T2 [Hipposideros larvatus]